MSVCVWYLCVRRGSKYFKVVSAWLTLVDFGSAFMFVKLHLHSTIIFIQNVTFIFCS